MLLGEAKSFAEPVMLAQREAESSSRTLKTYSGSLQPPSTKLEMEHKIFAGCISLFDQLQE